MNPVGLVFLLITVAGIAGIIYVTIPSIYNIGGAVADSVDGKATGSQVGGALISGIVLWLTTGFFIALIVIGVVLTLVCLNT